MISVIIPTLNEERLLGPTLHCLQRETHAHEIIISDGGSTDGTIARAERSSARVITSPQRGRAHQMNAGAAVARGSIFLFLHADTLIPRGGLDRIHQAFTREHAIGGGFARQYDSSNPVLRVTCYLATLRCRRTGLFLGDQGLFVRRDVFRDLDGFQATTRCEDIDLSRRMARRGRMVMIETPVVSSARRFRRRGVTMQTALDLKEAAYCLRRGR